MKFDGYQLISGEGCHGRIIEAHNWASDLGMMIQEMIEQDQSQNPDAHIFKVDVKEVYQREDGSEQRILVGQVTCAEVGNSWSFVPCRHMRETKFGISF